MPAKKIFISDYIRREINSESVTSTVKEYEEIRDDCENLLREIKKPNTTKAYTNIISIECYKIKAIQNILAAENMLAFLKARKEYAEIQKKLINKCAELAFDHRENLTSQYFKEVLDISLENMNLINEQITEVEQELNDI